MWRLPLFDEIGKRWLDFLPVEGKPAQFGADGLFFELGRSPNQRCAGHAKQRRSPVIVQEERDDHKQQAQSHDVGPPEQAKVAFATDDPDETEADDEEGSNAEHETEKVHFDQFSETSFTASCGLT